MAAGRGEPASCSPALNLIQGQPPAIAGTVLSTQPGCQPAHPSLAERQLLPP